MIIFFDEFLLVFVVKGMHSVGDGRLKKIPPSNSLKVT